MRGGSGGEDVTLASADGTKFRGYLVRADGDAGVHVDGQALYSFDEFESVIIAIAPNRVNADQIGCE